MKTELYTTLKQLDIFFEGGTIKAWTGDSPYRPKGAIARINLPEDRYNLNENGETIIEYK